MTIDDGCYDNMSQLLWRLMMVAMEICPSCYGDRVWLCTYALWLCQYVLCRGDEMNKDDLLADRSAVS